jgi:hypothetical protein
LSTTWLWLGVGTKMGAVGTPLDPANSSGRSTDDACIVHVPGTAGSGSGHCLATEGCVFQASGTKRNILINCSPAVPQSSVGLPPSGQGIASSGLVSCPIENIGTSTYRWAVCLMSCPAGPPSAQ